MEADSKKHGFWVILLGVVVVAIWNSLAWEAPTGGKVKIP